MTDINNITFQQAPIGAKFCDNNELDSVTWNALQSYVEIIAPKLKAYDALIVRFPIMLNGVVDMLVVYRYSGVVNGLRGFAYIWTYERRVVIASTPPEEITRDLYDAHSARVAEEFIETRRYRVAQTWVEAE